jgi:hypothetical protein
VSFLTRVLNLIEFILNFRNLGVRFDPRNRCEGNGDWQGVGEEGLRGAVLCARSFHCAPTVEMFQRIRNSD